MRNDRFRLGFVFLSLIAMSACGGDSTGPSAQPPPATGSVQVTTATTGEDLDLSAYLVIVASDTAVAEWNHVLNFTGLAAGDYRVDLTDVAENCSVGGGASRQVAVTAGSTAQVRFDVSCTALPPAEVDVTGTWSGPFSGTNDRGTNINGTLTYALEQDGDDVTADATYRQSDGGNAGVSFEFEGEGRVSGSTLTLFFAGSVNPGGHPNRVTSTAEVGPDRMAGRDEEQRGQWTAQYALTRQ